MSRASTRPARRALAVLSVAAAAAGGLSGCGTDDRTAYAEGWDEACGTVGEALSTFRTAVSSAVTDSPDEGDDAARVGAARAVAADLRRPAAALAEDLDAVREDVRVLRPPRDWAPWHAAELRRVDVRLRAVDAGVTRLGRGDADVLPLLAIGGIGPADVRAPAGLRDRTPGCTSLR